MVMLKVSVVVFGLVVLSWLAYIYVGDILSSPQGICSGYYGKICRGYLHDSARVWFNNSKENEGGLENENIVDGLWKEKFGTFEPKCLDAARVSKSNFILDCDSSFDYECLFSEIIVHLRVSTMWHEKRLSLRITFMLRRLCGGTGNILFQRLGPTRTKQAERYIS